MTVYSVYEVIEPGMVPVRLGIRRDSLCSTNNLGYNYVNSQRRILHNLLASDLRTNDRKWLNISLNVEPMRGRNTSDDDRGVVHLLFD